MSKSSYALALWENMRKTPKNNSALKKTISERVSEFGDPVFLWVTIIIDNWDQPYSDDALFEQCLGQGLLVGQCSA